jgi:hypothetical protein
MQMESLFTALVQWPVAISNLAICKRFEPPNLVSAIVIGRKDTVFGSVLSFDFGIGSASAKALFLSNGFKHLTISFINGVVFFGYYLMS